MGSTFGKEQIENFVPDSQCESGEEIMPNYGNQQEQDSDSASYDDNENISNDGDPDIESDSDESLTSDNLWGNRNDEIDDGQIIRFPEYVQAADDSEDRMIPLVFFLENDRPVVRIYDNEYNVGFLDLSYKEAMKLQQITDINVRMEIPQSFIKIDKYNVVDIQRIEGRDENPSHLSINQEQFATNMVRIQFSISEPLIAKYQNMIYTVGKRLYNEYRELIEYTQVPFGTAAIRIYQNRVVCDNENRVIDIVSSNSYSSGRVCFMKGSFEYDSQFLQTYGQLCSGHNRYIIGTDPYISIEKVDLKLIFSSNYDDCCEIYAENNFMFSALSRKKFELLPEKSPLSRRRSRTNSGRRSRTSSVRTSNSESSEDLDKTTDDSFGELEMSVLRKCPHNQNVNAIERNNISYKTLQAMPEYAPLFKKKAVRTHLPLYLSFSRMMIQLDQEAQAIYLEHYTCEIKLTYTYAEMKFVFAVPHVLAEMKAAIDENNLDRFVLIPMQTPLKKNFEIMGQILYIREDRVFVDIFPQSFKQIKRIYETETFTIKFQVNSVPYQQQHMALDYIVEHNLFNILINNSIYNARNMYQPIQQPTSAAIKMEGTMFTALNREQQTTVRNILSKADNLPYVLYGPPGTGKTRTIVGAIEQIVRTTDKNVLVCAMSNSACDEIAERLVTVLQNHEVFRMYAKSYRHSNVCETVKSISNWDKSYIRLPSLQRLYKYRVICTTIAMAGSFTRACISKDVWRADHFGYVFIDECASSSETMTWIPIAGLCTSPNTVHAKIILAGDPKQLDAITRSKMAQRLGLKRSWLEYLCGHELYKDKAGQFNENYISMLVKNYRSHPSILSLSNKLFYEGKLEPLASKTITDWYINSELLPSKEFPIIFKSVQGRCQRSGADTSLFNDEEIDAIKEYVKKLLSPNSQSSSRLRRIKDTDIGIVSPYKKQCWKLIQKFQRLGYDGITVGTAEVFQGKEKPVMIVSTVRADGASLGFVKEKRRFNVILTRAKCLLIIVGDPFTLRLDKYWRQLLEFCLHNNGLVQSNRIFTK